MALCLLIYSGEKLNRQNKLQRVIVILKTQRKFSAKFYTGYVAFVR